MSWRLLVTGGSGFIGTNVVERYRDAGVPTCSVDVASPRNADHLPLWTEVDLLDGPKLKKCVNVFRPSHVLHLGARTDLDGRSPEDYSANTVGTSNLIAALRSTPSVERVIFSSSRLVCKIGFQPKDEFDVCPTTPYGVSKVEGEKLVREAEGLIFDWAIVRPTLIWGPWFGVPYLGFFNAVISGRYINPKSRTIKKSFGYVGNTVHQLHRLLECEASGIDRQTFFLGDHEPLEVREWANTIAEQSGRASVKEAPMFVLRAAALAGDAIERITGRHAPLTSFRLDNLITEMVYDMSRLQSIVGPLPYSQEEGVEATLKWIGSQQTDSLDGQILKPATHTLT